MGRSKPKDRPPKRRPSAGRLEQASAEAVLARAASDVTARLEQIARNSQPRVIAGRRRPENDATVVGLEEQGVSLIDQGLIAPGRTTRSDLIAVAAQPDPDRPDRVILRFDGWEGHVEVVVPRDRAALLVRKLEQAVEMSREWTSGAGLKPGDVTVIVTPPVRPPAGRRSHRIGRGPAPKQVLEATDDVLDGLGGDHPGPGTSKRLREESEPIAGEG